MFCVIDSNGFLICMDEQDPSGDLPAGYTVAGADYSGTFDKPKWDGTAWVEGATPAEQTANFEAYRQSKVDEMLLECQRRLFEIHGQGALYSLAAHILKGLEANDRLNDTTPGSRPPGVWRPDGVGGKTHPILVKESAAFTAAGTPLTADELAGVVDGFAGSEHETIGDLEAVRNVHKGILQAAADTAALDTAWTNFVAAVDAVGT